MKYQKPWYVCVDRLDPITGEVYDTEVLARFINADDAERFLEKVEGRPIDGEWYTTRSTPRN